MAPMVMARIAIKRLKNPTRRELRVVKKLLAQLTDKKFDKKVFRQSGAEIYALIGLGQKAKPIIGMASIYFVDKMTGVQCFVEDVVVDEEYQGKGLGRKLMEHLIAIARKRKTKCIDLTSNPKRLAANALYKSLGFKLLAKAAKKGTNLYRLYL